MRIWELPQPLSTLKLEKPWTARVKQHRTHLPPRTDDSQGLRIGAHLCPVRGRNRSVGFRNSAGLEVDHRDDIRFNQQAVDRAGNNAPVWQSRGKWGLGERSLAEQWREA